MRVQLSTVLFFLHSSVCPSSCRILSCICFIAHFQSMKRGWDLPSSPRCCREYFTYLQTWLHYGFAEDRVFLGGWIIWSTFDKCRHRDPCHSLTSINPKIILNQYRKEVSQVAPNTDQTHFHLGVNDYSSLSGALLWLFLRINQQKPPNTCDWEKNH